jgi:hypothetical protein
MVNMKIEMNTNTHTKTTVLAIAGLALAGALTVSYGRGQTLEASAAVQTAAAAPAGCATITAENSDDCVRLNQVQVLGTHNSYHLAPKPAVLEGLGQRRQGLEYSHRTLTEQLSELGVRQFEIDVFADPNGGRYARPSAYKLTGDSVGPAMEAPGFKVLHVQDLDVRSTCPTLVACLTEIKAWSTANPGHLPVMIMIEAKDTPIENRPNFEFVKPHPIGAPELDALDAEIRSVFAADRVITPDSVRGDHATLDEALRKDGWPSLGRARGKVMFALDNTDRKRDEYLRGHPSLKGRMLFVTAPAGDPAVAFIKMNEARGPAEERIREQVKAGYLVRTRADEPTIEARSGETTRKDSAFRSGAQFVSTDYPEVSPFGSGYIARIPGPSGLIARCNPVSAPAGCRDEWLEPGRVDAKSPASPSTAGRRQ